MRTKIIATIGPSSMNSDIVSAMIREGASGFRINFSHGDEDSWREMIDSIKAASAKNDTTVAIIGDLRGPQVRIGRLGTPRKLRKGDSVKFINASETAEDKNEIPLSVSEFYRVVQQGDIVLVGDGDIQLRIIDIGREEAEAIALYDGVIQSGKKVVIKGKEIGLPVITDYDVKCIEFAIKHGFSHIAISYVRGLKDIEIVKETTRSRGGEISIISKIETVEALRNLDEIIGASDAILVARGDLGLHVELSEIPVIQRRIIKSTLRARKPVLVATEILESMVNQPTPARSDVTGIYAIVEEMVDAIVLTNETAIGKYPVESVRWARMIIEKAEKTMDTGFAVKVRESIKDRSLREKYARGLLNLAESVEGKILIFTKGNTIPPILSSLRPQVPVYIGTINEKIAMMLSIQYGINPVLLTRRDTRDLDYGEGLKELETTLREKRLVNIGDLVVEGYAKPELRLHEVIVKEVI